MNSTNRRIYHEIAIEGLHGILTSDQAHAHWAALNRIFAAQQQLKNSLVISFGFTPYEIAARERPEACTKPYELRLANNRRSAEVRLIVPPNFEEAAEDCFRSRFAELLAEAAERLASDLSSEELIESGAVVTDRVRAALLEYLALPLPISSPPLDGELMYLREPTVEFFIYFDNRGRAAAMARELEKNSYRCSVEEAEDGKWLCYVERDYDGDISDVNAIAPNPGEADRIERLALKFGGDFDGWSAG